MGAQNAVREGGDAVTQLPPFGENASTRITTEEVTRGAPGTRDHLHDSV